MSLALERPIPADRDRARDHGSDIAIAEAVVLTQPVSLIDTAAIPDDRYPFCLHNALHPTSGGSETSGIPLLTIM